MAVFNIIMFRREMITFGVVKQAAIYNKPHNGFATLAYPFSFETPKEAWAFIKKYPNIFSMRKNPEFVHN